MTALITQILLSINHNASVRHLGTRLEILFNNVIVKLLVQFKFLEIKVANAIMQTELSMVPRLLSAIVAQMFSDNPLLAARFFKVINVTAKMVMIL